MSNAQPSPLVKPTSLIVKNYSTSLANSKLQTPIKSPSPDHLCSSILTPTKVKYLGDASNVRGFQMYSSQLRTNSYHSGIEEMDQRRKQGKQLRGQQPRRDIDSDYMKQLEQQVKILLIENKNLLQKLSLTEQKSQPVLAEPEPNESVPAQRSQPNFSSAPEPPAPASRRSTTLIMQKIKEQYEEKLSTLKLMVQQEIKQAMSVVEDMCELMKNKMLVLENRVEGVEGRVSDIKIEKIKQMEHMFNATTNRIGEYGRFSHSPQSQRGRDVPYNVYNVENSISDILCVSIPEESQQQSKNQTITISKLEQEIQNLKRTISQTQQAYHQEKQYLTTLIEDKSKQINVLSHKLEELQRKNHMIEWKANGHLNNINIREELKLLQKNVSEIGDELIRSERGHEQALRALEEKNMECESMSQEISMLHVKLVDSEKQRIYLEQKAKFLESNISIIEHQLKQTKKALSKQIALRTSGQKERIKKLLTDSHKQSTQKNVLTLTSRIDRLLLLEEERCKQNERNLRYYEQHLNEGTGGRSERVDNKFDGEQEQTRLDKDE